MYEVNDLWDDWANLGETFRDVMGGGENDLAKEFFWKRLKIKKLTVLPAL